MDDSDPRPPVWVGHVHLRTADVAATADWMERIGMRSVFRGDDVSVLELRGGTHLVVLPGRGGGGADAGFDLMVEDLDATHAAFTSQGLEPSEVIRGDIHDSFRVRAPSGHTVTFNSTHVGDLPV